MTRPTGYSLTAYGDMITDTPRMDAYARALEAAVHPGATVLDIGAGTGIFSLLACRYGAARVHAIEPDDAIEVARTLAAANTYSDRITFHPTLSTQVQLDTKADVIVSDLRGVLPLFQHHVHAIVDARTRLLAPGGVLVPRRDTLWAALVSDVDTHKRYQEPWLHNRFEFDLTAAFPLVANTWRKVNAKPEQLVVPPQRWATLDYATITSPDVAGEVTWTNERAETAHGLLLWFDAELADGIGFSNAPGEPSLIYGQGYFPLQTPLSLEPGDTVTIALRADLVGDDYTWRWSTRVTGADGAPKARLVQSTFLASPLGPKQLIKREAGYQPTLDEDGEVDRFVLSLMDGDTALGTIAERSLAAFPRRFASVAEALAYVGTLSAKYAR